MADLIDRAALLADIDEAIVYSGRIGTNAEMRGANKIVDRIKAAPTVDAVPVVRCKDCECWDEENKSGRATLGTLVCACDNWSNQEDGHFRYTRPDDFCSYGERRTDDN